MRCTHKSGDAIRIIICGSIRAAGEILKAKASLESMGNEVEVPEGVKNMLIGKTSGSDEEKAEVKIRHGLILGYFNKIKAHEAVLVVNPEIEGVPGYIGGNTLIEMAFAHVLGPFHFESSGATSPFTSAALLSFIAKTATGQTSWQWEQPVHFFPEPLPLLPLAQLPCQGQA